VVTRDHRYDSGSEGDKAAHEALSESRRKAVNEWFDNTLLSRPNDKAKSCIFLIMQRLNQDDPIGEVLEQEPCDVLSFAVIAEHDETFILDSIRRSNLA